MTDTLLKKKIAQVAFNGFFRKEPIGVDQSYDLSVNTNESKLTLVVDGPNDNIKERRIFEIIVRERN